MVAAAALAEMAIILLSDFTFGKPVYFQMFASFAAVMCSGLLARRYGMARVGTALETLVLPLLAGAMISTGTFMTTAIARPFADTWLVAADQALGFDWRALFSVYQEHPRLVALSRYAYTSMFIQLPLIPLALVVLRREDRAWTFATAWAVAGAVCAAIHPFFPAAGPYVTFGIKPDDLPGLLRHFPWTTGPMIESIRSGELREITAAMGGLVSFPSFHAAAAIMLAWAAAPLRWIGIPLMVLNVAMWCSTIISGSHYFVDILAGSVLAIAAIAIAKRLTDVGRRLAN